MSNKNTHAQKPSSNKLTHYMKAPFRVLVRARDMYVSSMGGCAGRVERGRFISSSAAVPRSRSQGFYQSRSTTSNRGGEDINELIRAASQGRIGTLNTTVVKVKEVMVVPRSQSVAVGVGIGRIDEDQPCDFGDDQEINSYLRSRSCAVVDKKRRVGVGA